MWLRTKYVDVIVTGSTTQYIPMLEFYSGGLPLVSTMYASSECYFGLNLNPLSKASDVSYTLLPNMAYFEFLGGEKPWTSWCPIKRKNVSFPKPLYPLVHQYVLVETYEKGESVSYYIDDDDVLVRSDRTKHALAHMGTHALLKMLLVDNFVHANMHPGNILVRVAQGKPKEKGLFKSKPHVIFLDVGMTAELSGNDRDNLLEFFKAIAVRDGRTAAESTRNCQRNKPRPDPSAFIEGSGEVVYFGGYRRSLRKENGSEEGKSVRFWTLTHRHRGITAVAWARGMLCYGGSGGGGDDGDGSGGGDDGGGSGSSGGGGFNSLVVAGGG
ncbi:hypothetical protein IFM89_005035 [Coptis chinensis]|uniref:ABC1 atypical kinase-like domain-containing protein n=1 Tax=Coptis chinensis TaxID=261450 RepID=A0A835HIE1_9MAGN|nr:hypothetical protein IFM89_005035 [Coptis chinensis]